MDTRHPQDLDLNIARARLILAPATLLSIYVDVAKPDLTPWFRLTGGALEIDRYAFAVLLLHLAYSGIVHVLTNLRPMGDRFVAVTATIDVAFAIVVATFTEGPTSPSYAFFAFAIIAVGCREGFRATLVVTASSMLSYLTLIVLSAEAGQFHDYVMRPVYLAITGYLIGFLGQQRINFEARARELETTAERHSIARSLHDGYIQALAAVNLRLSGCRQLLQQGQVGSALRELTDLQTGVVREYDQVRSYVRSLIDQEGSSAPSGDPVATLFDLQANFRARGAKAEQVLLILLEGIRNTVRHADARAAVIRTVEAGDAIRITLDDDGVGFAEAIAPPWAIASRVAELGGAMRIVEARGTGAHLEIELPAG
jgi:signal transduction histidine kinase